MDMPDTTVLEQLINEAIGNLRSKASEEQQAAALRLLLMVGLHNLRDTAKMRRQITVLEEAAETWQEYPSLTWLLRYRTKPTLVVLATIATVVLALAGMGLWSFVARLLGVPIA